MGNKLRGSTFFNMLQHGSKPSKHRSQTGFLAPAVSHLRHQLKGWSRRSEEGAELHLEIGLEANLFEMATAWLMYINIDL